MTARLPFTGEQFFEVFGKYNEAVFPAQFVLILGACAVVLLIVYRKLFFDEMIAAALAFLWLWAGVVYHWIFFTEINSGAYLFGAAFVVQGLFFIYQGIVKKNLRFRLEPNASGILGAGFIIYALFVYPLVGFALGRVFPASPTFGAPCPTVIYTFGLMTLTDEKFPRHLLIIPLLWAAVGSTAAWNFGVAEDFGLALTATVGTIFILRRDFLPKKEVFL